MDFNDLSTRLESIFEAIGERYDDDIQNAVNPVPIITNNQPGLLIRFGSDTQAQRRNKLFNGIGAIANLKDHLKNKMIAAHKDANLVEQYINSNLELQLITDLYNKNKHGDSLAFSVRYPPRTNLDPKIGEIHQAMQISNAPGRNASVQLFPFSANEVDNEEGSEAIIEIMADVIDGSGNVIMDAGKMIEKSMDLWTSFIKLYDLS